MIRERVAEIAVVALLIICAGLMLVLKAVAWFLSDR
jgi:hypothetical protein